MQPSKKWNIEFREQILYIQESWKNVMSSIIGIKMNVLVLSDYGLTDTSTTKDVNIDDYIDMEDVQYLIYSSGYVSIIPYALKHEELLQKMSDMPGVDIYLAK